MTNDSFIAFFIYLFSFFFILGLLVWVGIEICTKMFWSEYQNHEDITSLTPAQLKDILSKPLKNKSND